MLPCQTAVGFFVNGKSPENPAGKEKRDAYADLAADPLPSKIELRKERDWFSEFPDESVTPVRTKSASWRNISEELADENN